MAKAVFTPCEGAIVKVPLCDAAGGSGSGTFNVTVGGTAIAFPTTGFLLEMQGNYQFLHSLDEFIYYYNFGDRIGELTVSGMGFMDGKDCGGEGSAGGGVCDIYNFYLGKRQSVEKKAMTIGAGSCGNFFGFLTGMRLEISASASSGGSPIGQWSLRFHVIPPRGVA